jgi:hypothetical protein
MARMAHCAFVVALSSARVSGSDPLPVGVAVKTCWKSGPAVCSQAPHHPRLVKRNNSIDTSISFPPYSYTNVHLRLGRVQRYNDIVQHDMGSMNVSQCCAMCKADVRCGIWVITPPGKCWIKSSYGIPTPAPGIISMCTAPGNPAVCPAPPPPPPPQHYICAGSQCVKGENTRLVSAPFVFCVCQLPCLFSLQHACHVCDLP